MRAVVQRAREASVSVAGEVVSASGAGLVILLGVGERDGVAEAERLAGKIARLRVFEDDEGRLDRSLLDVRGAALVVSQFTLLADSQLRKGTRPDFSKAASRDTAEPIYERFCEALRDSGVPVRTGVFGARMVVTIVNDGPVTLVLDA